MSPNDTRETKADVILWELLLSILGILILTVGLPLAFFLA